MLVDGGASASWVATNLAAIRTAFDKMCGETLTTGLVTPRRRLRPPRVLSRQQVVSLLGCLASPRDRLLASLIYATGLRISEALRLRARDVELDRDHIVVWRGKGGKVRVVPLPDRLRPSLAALCSDPDAYLFRAANATRHLGPRGLQRALRRAAEVANLGQGVTCHTLRHSFATHLLEDGMDIRVIQSLLGHERLETTHIYTHIASVTVSKVRSPFDTLGAPTPSLAMSQMTFRIAPRNDGRTSDVTVFLRGPVPVVLAGIEVEEQRPGWLCMRLPPEGDWKRSLARLPAEARATLESEDFYERLRNAVAAAFVKGKQHR
jgi:site-specific recombinase XerD